MPAKSAKQYGLMQAARSGSVEGISPSVASHFVHETPMNKRKQFSKALMKKRKKTEKGGYK